MTLLPVIARELRAQARQPFTYWVRVLGAGALLSTFLIFFPSIGLGMQMGERYFAILHRVLFFAIWILVPMMTADCISRERRENTLGLLFLTPLKATDIVLAKSFAHGLRAGTLCIAVLPVFTICFLMGGVSWKEVFMSVMMNFCSLCWALAAGILASSGTKLWTRALVGAEVWVAIFAFVFFALNGVVFFILALHGSPRHSDIEELLQVGFTLATNYHRETPAPWHVILNSLRTPRMAWLEGSSVMALLTLFGLWMIVQLAARNVRRNWQERPPSRLKVWWEKIFCTPVVMLSLFKRWMRFKLERNPIGWLEVRTWSGRLVIWGWFAVMISVMTIAFWDSNLYLQGFHALNSFMGWLLVLSIASSAAGSFQRERETGVLELLLVAPLKVQEIINGRLRGLWGQFLPATALLLGVWIYWTGLFDNAGELASIWFFATTFATLPVVGLYFSLASRNFIAALLRTIFTGIVLPIALPAIAKWLLWLLLLGFGLGHPRSPEIAFGVGAGFFQIILAFLFWQRLHRNLSQRKFSFERAMT